MVAITQVYEPRGNLVGFIVLEQLMDTAAAQASRGRDLPDGEAGVIRGDDGPDTILFSLVQTRRRQAQELDGLLFALEALSAFFSGFHTLGIPVWGSGVQQTGRARVPFCSVAPGKPITTSKILLDPTRWTMEREHAYTELQLPQAPEDFLAGLQREFDAVAHQVERGLSNNPFVAIRHGRLHLKRRDALEVPPRLTHLRRAIEGA